MCLKLAAETPTTCSPPAGTEGDGGDAKWTRIGDLGYIASLFATVSFALCVALFSGEGDDPSSVVFDPTWAKDGFCVSNPDDPFWTSHDLCLYADFILAGAGGMLYLALRGAPGMGPANDLVFFGLFGIAAHGLGHGNIAREIRAFGGSTLAREVDNPMERYLDEGGPAGLAKAAGPFAVFWFFLLKATMRDSPLSVVLPLSVLAMAGNTLCSPRFGFTYVQTILMLAFNTNQLVRPRESKGFAYGLYALVVTLPIPLVGWIESTQCESVIHYGGHLIYDGYIAVASNLFYVMYYFMRDAGTAEPKAKQM